MPIEKLWGPVETPDGVFVPGPHGVSADSEVYGGINAAVYIIESGGEAIITEPGYQTAPEYPPELLNLVTGLVDDRGLDVKYIVQTHFHFDHTGNTMYMKERYDAPVLCHPIEKEIIQDPMLGTSTEFIESLGGDPELVRREMGVESTDYLTFDEEVMREHWNNPIEVDDTVEDGDVLEVGELQIEVLHTPGHTPGHLSLWNPSSRSLYLQDVMILPDPIHPTPIGDAQDQIDSIEKCLDLEADYLFPGHGLQRCGPYDVKDYIEDMLLKQRQIAQRLRVLLARHGPVTVPDLHPELFPVPNRYIYAVDGMYLYGMGCIQTHLRRLFEMGEAGRVERDDGTFAWDATDDVQLDEGEADVHGNADRQLWLGDI